MRIAAPALKSPLRIGLTTSVIQRGKTGVAQYVFALIRALISLQKSEACNLPSDSLNPQPSTINPGFHLTLFVLEDDLPLFDFAAPHVKIVTVPECHRPAVKNVLWHQTKLPALARQHQLDVLHVPSYRRMLWRAPCATVATIHDLAPFHVAAKYDLARMFYGRVIARAIARRQDAIIAVSTSTAQDIERFFHIPQSQQTVVLNGLDHHRFHPGDPIAARKQIAQRWPQLTQPYFLYLSRLEHPAKNHVRLIAAYEQYRTAHAASTAAATASDTHHSPPYALALGGSDWHGAEAIHAAAASSPFTKDIHFLGFIDDAVLPDLYRAAGAMVYPSLFEGFGLPPVEAMACACPVISSTRGSLAEVIADATLAIDPESPASIATALAQVSTNHATRQFLITAGLANAQRFHWTQNAQRVLEVYHRAALAHHRATSPAPVRSGHSSLITHHS